MTTDPFEATPRPLSLVITRLMWDRGTTHAHEIGRDEASDTHDIKKKKLKKKKKKKLKNSQKKKKKKQL